jgi:uncharacterized protein (TIGR00251 family)
MKIQLRVQSRASRNNLVSLPDGQWKLAVTAPAIEKQANRASIDFLARQLGITRSHIRLVSGARSRTKTFNFDGVTED